VLQAQARPALLRGGDVAALAFAAGGIGHGVGFIKDNDAVESFLARRGFAARLLPTQSMIWAMRDFLSRSCERRVA
jgi:hypothetical protein